MNIKDYISSGILESYVLGVTSVEETQEVENYAKLYPEIQQEIEAIQAALNQYATEHLQTPPPELKQKIWSAIQQSENKNVEENGTKETNPKIVSIDSKVQKNNFTQWLAAASVVLLLGALALNVFFYNKWKSTEKELIALTTEKEYLAQQYQIQKTALDQTKNEFAFLVQPTTKAISLKGVTNFADALATVYWNSNTEEVYLTVNNLPLPPADKQYQLWAIVDGKPIDAGVFDASQGLKGIQKMKKFKTVQAFAVTLEKKGGSPTPNLQAMYVIGNV